MSGLQPGENLVVDLGAAMAVLPGVGLLSLVWLYALAVGVALIVLALRVWGLRKGRGLQGVLNREEATNDHATRRHKRARRRRPAHHEPA